MVGPLGIKNFNSDVASHFPQTDFTNRFALP